MTSAELTKKERKKKGFLMNQIVSKCKEKKIIKEKEIFNMWYVRKDHQGKETEKKNLR